MKRRILFMGLLMLLENGCVFLFAQNEEKTFVKENLDFAVTQVMQMLEKVDAARDQMPYSLTKDGKTMFRPIDWWTAGFFPGTLWYLSEYSGNETLRQQARIWTEKMEPIKNYTGNHDVGFMMYCSYGNAYRLKSTDTDLQILIQSARSLCSRYSPVTGTIKSWNTWHSWNGDEVFQFPVIIDNMMNLELLFFVSNATGDPYFRNIAVSHAEKTMENQIREDGSSFHLTLYDPETGRFIKGETSQGFSDNSTWSRGQAWGIYGFTMTYRATKDIRFLKTAIKMADFYVNHKNLPADQVAWWDFNAYQPGFVPGKRSNAWRTTTNYRDASAAAITASALLELSLYTENEQSEKYKHVAIRILHALGSPVYRSEVGENGFFILKHSVGALPQHSDIDVPLIYADYYFIEALMRYEALLNGKPLPIYRLEEEN